MCWAAGCALDEDMARDSEMQAREGGISRCVRLGLRVVGVEITRSTACYRGDEGGELTGRPRLSIGTIPYTYAQCWAK
jgi:hypothetical protein